MAFIVSNVFALPAVYFLLHFIAALMDLLVCTFSTGFIFGLTGGYSGAVEMNSTYFEAVEVALPILSLCYAILVAIAVWSYLYQHRSVTMMHTLPIQREGLYLTNVLSGMAMLLIPYVVVGVLMVVITLAFGLFDLGALLITVAAVIGESFF